MAFPWFFLAEESHFYFINETHFVIGNLCGLNPKGKKTKKNGSRYVNQIAFKFEKQNKSQLTMCLPAVSVYNMNLLPPPHIKFEF